MAILFLAIFRSKCPKRALPDVMLPDLLVRCDASEKTNDKGRYKGIPALTLEILSPGTRSIDRVCKLNTFMMSGDAEGS